MCGMPININNQRICLQNGIMPDREYCKTQEAQVKQQKALCRDTVEITDFKGNKEAVIDRVNHTVMQSAALFSDMRAEILQEVREDKGEYGYAEVVNACGLSYARLYAEIEERHQTGEQFYNPDGTILTKEDEIGLLDKAFENEVAWQKSCTQVAAQREVFLGNLTKAPDKEIGELEECFYKAKEAYMSMYEESKQTGKPLTLQNTLFSNADIYELFDKVRNFG